MKRYYIISVSIVIALLVFFSAALVGCSGWFGKPEDCKNAVFDAIKSEDADAFFAYILSAPEDEEEKALLFQRTIDRFKPYLDGNVMSTNDIDEWVVLNVAPSSEYLESFGTTIAPLPLAFKKSKGWKLDLEYTDKLKELQDIYKGIYKGF